MTPPLVLLVNPRMAKPRGVRLPLSLLALGAVLEGRYRYFLVDGNLDDDALETVRRHLATAESALVGFTVMPGPQVLPALEMASAVRRLRPDVPIVWGGYFPTLFPDAAINAPYVDYVVRGQGEETLLELLACQAAGELLPAAERAANPSQGEEAVGEIPGLTWKSGGSVIHNPGRSFRPPDQFPIYPYERLSGLDRYFLPTFLGRRTAVHQAAIGCRYHCEFCGVVSMFNGETELSGAERLAEVLGILRQRYGADAVQFYDHNFFDREESSVPVLEVLAREQLPWWCYARSDTLAGFSDKTWELIRQSRLRMAYIGAEAASDAVLRNMRKGTRVEQTLEVAARCREFGVTPEFSFVVGGPEDPEGEIDTTFRFIKHLKGIHPECEVILYFYSPTPQMGQQIDPSAVAIPRLETYGPGGPPLPKTPEEWAEPQWVRYICHQDAPWLTPQLRRRVHDFATVLQCRFPTAQDWTTPGWGKWILQRLAGWRYERDLYDHPRELRLAKRLIPLHQPREESI